MAKKYYAIKEGYDLVNKTRVENKIVSTWSECLSYVKGVKGAKYKSFESLEDAKEYLSDDKKLLKKGVDLYPQDWLHIYVDGSYNISTEKFSYGLVALRNDVISYVESGSAEDNSQKQLRQISGELKAATRALEYAVSQKEKKLVIFHDYEGIFHHAVGTWERKDESSKKYYDFMNSIIQKHNLEIVFVKIDSHTGDIYNEIADCYAKLSAGMEMTGAVDKWLSSNMLKVIDDNIKHDVQRIISNKMHERIVSMGDNCNSQGNVKVEIKNIIEELNTLKIGNDEIIIEYLTKLDSGTKDKLILELVKNI